MRRRPRLLSLRGRLRHVRDRQRAGSEHEGTLDTAPCMDRSKKKSVVFQLFVSKPNLTWKNGHLHAQRTQRWQCTPNGWPKDRGRMAAGQRTLGHFHAVIEEVRRSKRDDEHKCKLLLNDGDVLASRLCRPTWLPLPLRNSSATSQAALERPPCKDPNLLHRNTVTIRWPLTDGTGLAFTDAKLYRRSERVHHCNMEHAPSPMLCRGCNRYKIVFVDGDVRWSCLIGKHSFTVSESDYIKAATWTHPEEGALIKRFRASPIELCSSIAHSLNR